MQLSYIVCIEFIHLMQYMRVFLYMLVIYICPSIYIYTHPPPPPPTHIYVPKNGKVGRRCTGAYYFGIITQYITRSYECRLNNICRGMNFVFLLSFSTRKVTEMRLYKTFLSDCNKFYVPSLLMLRHLRE